VTPVEVSFFTAMASKIGSKIDAIAGDTRKLRAIQSYYAERAKTEAAGIYKKTRKVVAK
jgi:hypothetical protein